MEKYYIEAKNVQAIPVLTVLEEIAVSSLEEVAKDLHYQAEANAKESLICISEVANLDPDTKVKVCCPIHDIDLYYDKEKYKIEVLPRTLVLSTIHLGQYNDLKDVFKTMNEYIIKNKLSTGLPYRMVFYREKRRKERPLLHQPPVNPYVTEVHIPLFDS